MKLQNILLIFLVIALPVIIILSVYIEYQVDTSLQKSEYSDKLLSATYDTVVTFQLNTTNNKYSSVSDSLIRDIEASINTFSASLAKNLGMGGANKSYSMSYIPALLFTLYDGYYIYIPEAKDNGTFQHTLKPYVYYTKEYTDLNNKKMVINFSLDNYVAVYYNDKNNSYRSRAGYLEVIDKNNGVWVEGDTVTYKGVEIQKNETLYKKTYTFELDTEGYIVTEPNNTFNNNVDVTENSTSAYDYYKEAFEFTNWYNEQIIKPMFSITSNEYKALYIDKNNVPLPGVQSSFNDEKNNVIEDSITKNLIQAMEIFSTYADVEFKMPKLTGEDWYTILNNVCVISFMQGIPCGTTVYNDYVIVPSTQNKQYINEKGIYYIGYNAIKNPEGVIIGYESNGTTHRIGCPHLDGDIFVRL